MAFLGIKLVFMFFFERKQKLFLNKKTASNG